MVSEELSQDEIDSLFSSEEQEENKNDINPAIKEFANIFNTSLENVLKTAFSLEVVSKFVDLSLKSKEDVSFEEGVFITMELSMDDNKAQCFIYIKKEFASILADLMLMGPGESKENMEPDDLDAIKELFSQVFGNLQTSLKESIQKDLSVEIKDVVEEDEKLSEDSVYDIEFDVAIPNIKSDNISFFANKTQLDNLFIEKEREQETEQEETSETVPFENVENIQEDSKINSIQPPQIPSGNLDLIMDVDLDVKIRIGEKNMLIKDILHLKEGSIVELEKNIDEPMEILINNKVVAKGVVVVVGGRFGIKITNIDTKEERIKSLGG